MKKGKIKRLGAQTLVTILAIMLIVGGVVGGTMAWLVDSTEDVVNTFTYGDINIDLEETPTDDGDGDENTNEYKMLPGATINKDPKVTVKQGSESSWLFVKLVESCTAEIYDSEGNLVASYGFDDFLAYAIADGWTALTADIDGNPIEGVYYLEVPAEMVKDGDVVLGVLKDNTVTVKGSVTKEMLEALTGYPTLTVTAYAVQREGVDTAVQAWALVQNPAQDTVPTVPAP